jgi:hypothetical protein
VLAKMVGMFIVSTFEGEGNNLPTMPLSTPTQLVQQGLDTRRIPHVGVNVFSLERQRKVGQQFGVTWQIVLKRKVEHEIL